MQINCGEPMNKSKDKYRQMCGPLPTIACFHPFVPEEKKNLPNYYL